MEAADSDQSVQSDQIVQRVRERARERSDGRLPRLVRFSGFVDVEAAEEDGHVRLIDPDDFAHVIEIPRSAIHYQWPDDPALTPADGSSLWIDYDADCRHLVPDTGEPASFLAGEIAEGAYGVLLDANARPTCTRWRSFSR